VSSASADDDAHQPSVKRPDLFRFLNGQIAHGIDVTSFSSTILMLNHNTSSAPSAHTHADPDSKAEIVVVLPRRVEPEEDSGRRASACISNIAFFPRLARFFMVSS
jgi:hypothetical protein